MKSAIVGKSIYLQIISNRHYLHSNRSLIEVVKFKRIHQYSNDTSINKNFVITGLQRDAFVGHIE